MLQDYIFTSESVTEGHPDKIADQISDNILDALLKEDPKARVACETLITTGLIQLAGEITTTANIDYHQIARDTVRKIGYDHSDKGFDATTCAVNLALGRQSVDIAAGVNIGEGIDLDQGAGDQGIMFGYAIDETENFMPLSIDLSHRLARRLAGVRHDNIIKDLRADGKTQVSVEYVNGQVKRIDTVVVSTQHAASVKQVDLREAIIEHVIKGEVDPKLIDSKTKFFVNPTGKFVIGGPMGDVGLTGRKIIVDTYGGHGAHGGGAFSGKDPTKVDRSAAYAARSVAKHVVAAGLAKKALVQVAYAIGVSKPVSFLVNTFETNTVSNDKITEAINKVFDMRPRAIIENFDLMRPIYSDTAAYGHFGREDKDFPWERLNRLEELKSHF